MTIIITGILPSIALRDGSAGVTVSQWIRCKTLHCLVHFKHQDEQTPLLQQRWREGGGNEKKGVGIRQEHCTVEQLDP